MLSKFAGSYLAIIILTIFCGCSNIATANKALIEWGQLKHHVNLDAAEAIPNKDYRSPIRLRRYIIPKEAGEDLLPRSAEPKLVLSPTFQSYLNHFMITSGCLNSPSCMSQLPQVPEVPVTDTIVIGDGPSYENVSNLLEATAEAQGKALAFLDFQRFAKGDVIRIESPGNGIFTFDHVFHDPQPLDENWEDVYVALRVIRLSRPNSAEAWASFSPSNYSGANDPRYLDKSQVFKVREDGRWDAVIIPSNPKCFSVKTNGNILPEDAGPDGKAFSVNPWSNIDCHTEGGVNGPFMQCYTTMRSYLSAEKNDMVSLEISFGRSWQRLNGECIVTDQAHHYVKIPTLIMSDCNGTGCPAVNLNPQPTPVSGGGSSGIAPVCNQLEISSQREKLIEVGNQQYKLVLAAARTFVQSANETGKGKAKSRKLFQAVRLLGTHLNLYAEQIPHTTLLCSRESDHCKLKDISSSLSGYQEQSSTLVKKLKVIHKGINLNFTKSRFSHLSSLQQILSTQLHKEMKNAEKLQSELNTAAERIPYTNFECSIN